MRKSAMPEAARLVTAEELERMSRPRCELVDGRLVEMSPVSLDHGRVVLQFGSLLQSYVNRLRLGVVGTEVGFKLASNPDTVRGPDLAFLRRDRVATARPRGFVDGAPDLAVEVLSPEDRPGEVRRKINEYLTCGASLVIIVDPETKTVDVHRQNLPSTRVTDADAVLDLDSAIPGFHCTLREIFD
jgi:Uma2 family endonuclease